MANSVYKINKGINKSIEWKGLKAEYIWWFRGGIIGLLIMFVMMYLIVFNRLASLGVILIAGTCLFIHLLKLSRVYSEEYGRIKKIAWRKVPKLITCNSRKLFMAQAALTPPLRGRIEKPSLLEGFRKT